MSRSRTLALAAVLALLVAPLAQAEHEYADRYGNNDRYGSNDYRYNDRYSGYDDRYSSQRYTTRYNTGYQSDRILHDEVHDAIERALGYEASRIRVDVRRGHVYLSGSVRDYRARSIAHDVAHDVPGVHGVYVNRLYTRRY